MGTQDKTTNTNKMSKMIELAKELGEEAFRCGWRSWENPFYERDKRHKKLVDGFDRGFNQARNSK